MPDFTFVARSLQTGHTQKGTITAVSKTAAMTTLREKQLLPLMVKDAKRGGLTIKIGLPGSNKIKARAIVVFTRQFATMINAGVPILHSLSILKDQSESVPLKKVLASVAADVEGGSTLSAAMAKHPEAFSQIYVNMVRAGESGGILDKVLLRLATQQEKDTALKNKIRGAMIYPIVILTVTLVAFFVLMTFIVPKIGDILTQLSNGKAELPIYTQILLSMSHVMQQPLFIVCVVTGVPLAIYFFRKYIHTPKGRYAWHSFILKIPVIKVIVTKTAIARFARVFASLMGAGVSIVSAIETTANAMGNAVIEKELFKSSKAIQAGSQLSTELSKSKYFPPIVSQMLLVGEETGQTDTVVLKVAEFYEEEVDTAVGALSSIIEPVTIVLLGGMVGIVVLSVFGPITELSTSASG